MRKVSRGQLAFPIFAADHAAGKRGLLAGKSGREAVAFQAALRGLAREVWPHKTAQHLALHADVHLRHAERFLEGKRGLSLAPIVRLLRGLHGERFLALIMAEARPQWWVEIAQERRITAVKRRRRALEQELRELEAGL
jgi:hypothetical protein